MHIIHDMLYWAGRQLTNTSLAERTRRSISLGDVWPPKSVENWIEVVVVVDGPMVRYHGSKVRHYVLTLMRMVSGGAGDWW